MSDPIEIVQGVLVGSAAVTALVPALRIRPPGNWQNITLPYIVHRPSSVEPTRTHDGLKTLAIYNYYQVMIFSTSASEGAAIRDAVITAMDGNHAGTEIHFTGGSVFSAVDYDTGVLQFLAGFSVAVSS